MIHSRGVRRCYLSSLLLILALTLASCSEETTPSEPEPEEDLKGVFISGTGRNLEGIAAATYWHDGTPKNLAVTQPIYSSSGYRMTVSGSDVYVCGILYTGQGNLPVYWKNGTPVILTPGNGRAMGIAVVDNDVYVAGTVEASNGNQYAVVWKNGTISYLTEGTTYSNAVTLIVSGQDVYVAGNIIQDNKTYASYWKNGTAHLLALGDAFAYIHSLALDGETVYAAGRLGTSNIGAYFKNDQVINLTDGTSKVEVFAVYTKGSDVYVAGRRQTDASWELVVWKNNNIIITSPINGFHLEIGDITVESNDVLVTGSIVHKHEDSSIHADATLWTNGVLETLLQGSDGSNVCFANSIVVK